MFLGIKGNKRIETASQRGERGKHGGGGGFWEFIGDRDYTQGRNEVYFFIADPVFLRKFLIPDPKSDENFDP